MHETIYEPNIASDLLREAIRDTLRAINVIKTCDSAYEKAKRKEVKVYR